MDIVKNRNLKQIKIQKFNKRIEIHYFTSLKIPSSYADILNISDNYLNKLCKEKSGLTADDLIRKQIIIVAQRLLHFTNFTINEIAYKLGFDSISCFVTFFKKQTPKTPKQFRKEENN